MVDEGTPALNRSRETRAHTQSGYLMLLIWFVLAGLALWAGISNGTAEYQVAEMGGWRARRWSVFDPVRFYLINFQRSRGDPAVRHYKGTDRETVRAGCCRG